MKTCTFFGHSDAPQNLKRTIKEKISELIIECGVEIFYVGNHGQFDLMVISVLKELKNFYHQIDYNIVLAYFPKETNQYDNSILPDGIELCHPKAAVDYRNRWMLEKSDYVITYVTCSWGGAAKYKNLAIKHGKSVINLADL